MPRLLLLSLSIILLFGCATQKNSYKGDADVSLGSGEGFLIMGVDTNFPLETIVLSAPGIKSITLSKNDLKSGKNFILVNLEPGEYTISEIEVSSNYYFSMKKENWRFVISPHSINYAGNLKVRTEHMFSNHAYFAMMNESSIALEFLQEKFPSLLSSKELRYVGPGTDDYYRFALPTNK